MSCKSALYAGNTGSSVVPVNGEVPFGSVIRKYGNDIALSGNTVFLCDYGYYDVDVNITFTGNETGDAVFTIYQDGVPYPAATKKVTVTTAQTEFIGISIPAIIRNCTKCCKSAIKVIVTGIPVTVTNFGITVEKI